MTTPEEFAPADAAPAAPIAPAHPKKSIPPKKTEKAAPKPKPPTVNKSLTVETPPIGRPDFGHKDPDVIRWHLNRHPKRMEEIYGSFDWRKLLSLHPEDSTELTEHRL